jgi:hypothetical protein
MADRHIVSSPALPKSRVMTDQCPRVAELIDYALGQGSNDDRQRVEAHLKGDDCTVCRSWVEKANGFRAEPNPNQCSPHVPGEEVVTRGVTNTLANGSLTPSPSPVPPSSPSVNDPTPIPPSSKFQRQALRDLEERLRLLEENG